VFFPDLRFGSAPLREAFPGYDPAGDARALVPSGHVSPATAPIPGHQFFGSFGPGSRYVVKIPAAWNGNLVVCGTPATRSEHANDLTFGDFLMARGYAVASSNKGIPYNAFVEPTGGDSPAGRAYPIPFAMGDAPPGSAAIRLGALDPERVPVAAWHEDLPHLVRTASDIVRDTLGRKAVRTYAVGLSIGGGQVRYLVERYPELVDGALEWASVYWHPDDNILTYLPAFLTQMPAYVASGYADRAAHDAIVAAGFPPDRVQGRPHVSSLWNSHYAALPPFYADLTIFLFAKLLDPHAPALDTPAARAAYVPSPAARAAVGAFAHSGKIERPLIGIAGDADVFVTPQHHFAPYVAAVRAAKRDDRYWPYLVRGGTHVDGYAALGWNLQAQLPFVWAGFERLVRIVERGERPAGAGTIRTVDTPAAL